MKKLLLLLTLVAFGASASERVNMTCEFDALAAGYTSKSYSVNMILADGDLYNQDGSTGPFQGKSIYANGDNAGDWYVEVYDGSDFQGVGGYNYFKDTSAWTTSLNVGTIGCKLIKGWAPEYYTSVDVPEDPEDDVTDSVSNDSEEVEGEGDDDISSSTGSDNPPTPKGSWFNTPGSTLKDNYFVGTNINPVSRACNNYFVTARDAAGNATEAQDLQLKKYKIVDAGQGVYIVPEHGSKTPSLRYGSKSIPIPYRKGLPINMNWWYSVGGINMKAIHGDPLGILELNDLFAKTDLDKRKSW